MAQPWQWDNMIIATRSTCKMDIDTAFTDYYYNNILEPAYSADNRFYHTIDHVLDMISHFKEFFGFKRHERQILKWAIWFHDIEYDVNRNDNEQRSADKLVDFMTALDFDEKHIEMARWAVLVTTHKGNPQNILEEAICDLDLRGLGTDQYDIHKQNIRKEYRSFDNKTWTKGRKEFIEFMLNKEYIYHSVPYRQTLEPKARYNLQKELDTLSK